MATRVSVILPTYNEKGNIAELSRALIPQVRKAGYAPEIVIVDDSSPDGTGKLAKELSKRHREIKAVVRTERGLATAVLRGVRESTGSIIVVMDTDFSHPPEFVPALLREMEGADAVFASRYVMGGSMRMDVLQYWFSKLFNYVIKALLGIKVLDSTGGFFAIRKDALKGVLTESVFHGYGDYCFRMLYALKPARLKIREIPFKYMPRRYGKSKTPLLKTAIKYGIEALRLRLG
jgi:dolichol-phosphate mannosyltransferase